MALIAGRPLGQIFPAKASSVGPPLFAVAGLSGHGFDQVDLAVHAGEIVGLAGIEGEGQREFIRAAAGIDRRHSGEVRVRDAAISGDSPGAFRKAGIGFISDDRHTEGVFLSLTLRENLGLGFLDAISRSGVIDQAKEIERARKITENLRIRAASIESKLFELSGGNQQKALFGREIAAQPTVLLVDEPTKGVDIGARSEIYQRLRALADQGMAVLVSSSDGIELEGLCDRVLIFARGRIVNELAGAAVTDAAITEANLTATVSRVSAAAASRPRRSGYKFLSSDHFPALVLAALTAIIIGGTQALNGYFLSPVSIKSMLSFFSILAFLSSAQLATVLVGAIDLSVGALAGFCVVLASFLAPDGVDGLALAGGLVLIMAFTVGFGLLQGLLITSLRLPAIVVTIATFIGLQGVSLLLRPTAAGMIDDAISDAAQFPLWLLPAGVALTLAMAAGAEWLLYRTGFGRSFRAVGSSSAREPPAGHRQPAADRARLRHLGAAHRHRRADACRSGRYRLAVDRHRLYADEHHRRGAGRRERRRRSRLVREHAARRGLGAGDLERLILHRRQLLRTLHRHRHAHSAGRDLLQRGAAARRRGRRVNALKPLVGDDAHGASASICPVSG